MLAPVSTSQLLVQRTVPALRVSSSGSAGMPMHSCPAPVLRVFACSRWGCQWQDTCHEVNGTKACAPILQTFGMAAAAIWQSDPTVPVFINGLGQDNSTKYRQCGNYYPGMHWGDGFITNKDMIQKYGISDPSDIFTTAFTQKLGFVRIEHGKPQVGACQGCVWPL